MSRNRYDTDVHRWVFRAARAQGLTVTVGQTVSMPWLMHDAATLLLPTGMEQPSFLWAVSRAVVDLHFPGTCIRLDDKNVTVADAPIRTRPALHLVTGGSR
jgi:hypothetical protein